MSHDARRFPILESSQRIVGAGFPASIPWAAIAPHAKQAVRNHSQTLERLAERGGLGWSEALLILQDREWDGRAFHLPKEQEAYRASEVAAAKAVLALLQERSPA